MSLLNVSRHLWDVFDCLSSLGTYASVATIAETSGGNPNTVKQHIRRLFRRGILERTDTYPHLYRISDTARIRCPEELARLEGAREVFSV